MARLLRAARIDPDTGFVDATRRLSNPDDDLENTPLHEWPQHLRNQLREQAAHELLDEDMDLAKQRFGVPDDDRVTPEQMAAVRRAETLERDGYRIERTLDGTHTTRWTDPKTGLTCHPFGGFAEQNPEGRTFFMTGPRYSEGGGKVFTEETGGAIRFHGEVPGIPEAMVNPANHTAYFDTRANSVTDALGDEWNSYAAGMWADAGFGTRHPDTIGVTEIDWSHGRPAGQGPSMVQWEGFVTYTGTPTTQDLARDNTEPVPGTGSDGWQYRIRGAGVDRQKWSGYDTLRGVLFQDASKAVAHQVFLLKQAGRARFEERLATKR